jgi:broad specificity phosphatase PhoE
MTEFWLVRHGQTDWNLTGRWQGQAHAAPGLNDVGQAQTLRAREKLNGHSFSAIYSSDLLRSRQTAELLADPLRLTVTLEPCLREMDLGNWEGMRSQEIEANYPQEMAERARDPFHTRAPNGESPREVAERVLPTINEIARKQSDTSILVVSHGISLAAIICHVEGFRMQDIYQHIPNNAEPYHVKWRHGKLLAQLLQPLRSESVFQLSSKASCDMPIAPTWAISQSVQQGTRTQSDAQ